MTPKWLCAPLKALKSETGRKTMLILFHDAYGVIHLEFVLPRETVDSDFYCEVLDRLMTKIQCKRPGMWTGSADGNTNHDYCLLHNNATPHTSYITLTKIGESNIMLVSHPQYSPDLSPCDFWSFPYLKKCLRGCRFLNLPAVQKEVRRILIHDTPKELFYECMENLAVWWKKCVAAGGQYFEGINIQIEEILEAEVTEEEEESHATEDNE